MKTKTKTKQKILKVVAICILFLGNSQLMAQMNDLPTQTVCVGDIEPYTLVNPVSGAPTANYSYQWSTTGGIIVGGISIGDNIDIDWNTVGVYTITVVATDNITGCEDSPIDVVVTVEDLANLPLVTNPAPICLGDLNPQMTAATGGGTGNGVFNWYADNALTTLLLANSSIYTDPISYPIDNTYTYWVTEESANGCEGTATLVSVIVTPLPLAPTLVGLPYDACFDLPNPLFTATSATGASNFNWYNVDPLVTPGAPQLATGIASYASTESNPSTYTYWVEEVVGSCTSIATSFTFIINPPPASPSVTPLTITICEGETPQDFVVTSGGANGTYDWYSDLALTINVGNGTPFAPTQVATGTYDYWLTETDLTTNCVSAPTTATFTINTLPLLPTVTAAPSAVICFGDINPTFTSVADPLSTGTGDFYWYDDDPVANPLAVALNPLAPSTTFQPSVTAVSPLGVPYQYWVREFNVTTGCKGDPVMFTFEIIDLPVAPVCTDEPICLNQPLPTFTPSTGTNLFWYDDVLLGNQVGVGPTYTAGTNQIPPPLAVGTYSYWIVDQPGTCVSPPLQVDLIINPLPTPGPIWHN